jgi:hypothetical protein
MILQMCLIVSNFLCAKLLVSTRSGNKKDEKKHVNVCETPKNDYFCK